jgi:diguanylate cyclase (GGDEF)-like protein
VVLGDAASSFAAAIAQLINHEGALVLSRTDPLTGLLNRRGFTKEASRRIARLDRAPHPACLLYIDLDNFKLVNDARGHQAGDAVLRDVAKILHDNSRSGDLIARIGGDEFVMWLDGITEATAERRAEAILARCAALAGLSGDSERPFGVSIGLAAHDANQSGGPEEMLARADAAMYRAKRRGGGRFSHAKPTGAGGEPGETP